MKFYIIALIFFLPPTVSYAQHKTANDWKCTNKVGGEWNFGLAPSACDVSPFMNSAKVEELYSPLIFSNEAERDDERKRYMQEFYSFVRDFSAYYLRQRKNPSAAEVDAWQKAVFTIAYQESFWSHYRNRDNSIKMMRGDFGHGHGVMQVDDRWHYTKVKDDQVGANLSRNILYALEIYYNAWQKAPSQSCVSSSSNWVARTRAAYSAYNGGGTVYCRWTNPNHKWYRNDKNYYDKYKSQKWESYVADKNKKASLDAGCLAEEKADCGSNNTDPNPASLVKGRFYQTIKGKVCSYDGNKLHCIESVRDMSCLNVLLGTEVKETHLIEANVLSQYRLTAYDRHQLCVDNINSLVPVQNHIMTHKPISFLNDQKIPIKEIPKGEKLYLIDFHVINQPGYAIHYLVQWNSEKGYIIAGSHFEPEEMFTVIADENDIKFLANVGDIIEVENSGGINQRSSIKGTYLQNIPKGQQLEVVDRELRGTEGRSYFLVNYKNKQGYIYGGQLNPNTVHKWTKLVLKKENQTVASLKANLWYVMPRECASDQCKKSASALWSSKKYKANPDQAHFEVLEEKGDWIRIYSHNDNTHGWIKKEVTNEF